MENLKFPDNFLWGSATSAYQAEGGIEDNDWAEAARLGKIPAAGRAADHYNLYEKDFDLAKELGHNAHRMSLEWARIEPEEGKFDDKEIEHYRKVILALRERGLEPFVTLWHFTLPLWFVKIGGFENPKAPEIFARYCGYAVERLGDRVRFWLTINEPMVYASNGYLKGKWPPFKKNFFAFKKVIKTLISSHLASHIVILRHYMSQNQTILGNTKNVSPNIVTRNPAVKIGIAKNNIFFEGWPLLNYFWNFYFLNKIKNHLDFIGLNYYFHKRFPKNRNKEVSDTGWEIYPEGIYHVLKDLKRYNLPIYITENGLADAQDEKREKFIKDHLFWAHKAISGGVDPVRNLARAQARSGGPLGRAISNGVDLRGYFYWSLLDNFEWADGFEPRFGLAEVDYETMERRVRPSAWEYAKICRSGKLEL